jgi:8-amino-7-oxononanoate synthase
MYQLDQAPGRTVWTSSKEYLFFSGYSYLGMSHVEEFTDLVKEGIDKYGFLYPSSPISNTRLELYQTFEHVLSTLVGTDETVTFSSGYLAGRAIADIITKRNKHIFSAPSTHPAIHSGETLPADDWKNYLIKTINQSSADSFVLFMDSVNPLTATVANFSFLYELNPDKQLTCIIDDSHGIGLLGPVAQGVSHLLPTLHNVEFVISYSLSKAFNINGGAVSCSARIAKLLRSSPFYAGSTAIAPPMVHAFIHGHGLYIQQLKKLQQNISDFIKVTNDIGGIHFYPHLPVFVLKKEFEQKHFDPHRIIISSFAYPDPMGNKINRAVINALHTKQDLFKLSCVINQLQQNLFEV